jgi:hypothetical protein
MEVNWCLLPLLLALATAVRGWGEYPLPLPSPTPSHPAGLHRSVLAGHVGMPRTRTRDFSPRFGGLSGSLGWLSSGYCEQRTPG